MSSVEPPSPSSSTSSTRRRLVAALEAAAIEAATDLDTGPNTPTSTSGPPSPIRPSSAGLLPSLAAAQNAARQARESRALYTEQAAKDHDANNYNTTATLYVTPPSPARPSSRQSEAGLPKPALPPLRRPSKP